MSNAYAAKFGLCKQEGFVPTPQTNAPESPALQITSATEEEKSTSAGDRSPRFTLLSKMALIKIQGPDTEKFLQGQFTCDLRKLEKNQWRLGACCTAKGRMIGNFLIAHINDQFWLRLPADNAEALVTHLTKYAVFFKSELEIQTDAIIAGRWTKYPSLDNESGTKESAEINGDITQYPDLTEGNYLLSWPDGRQELWLQEEYADDVIKSAADNHQLVAEKQWQTADIESRLLWIDFEQSDSWIPQQIGWHILGGISFQKGCYTGQEIIARLQYLGKSKKQLCYARLTDDSVISTDVSINVPSDIKHSDGEKSLGHLLSWSGQHGLAISQISEATTALVAFSQETDEQTDTEAAGNYLTIELIPVIPETAQTSDSDK